MQKIRKGDEIIVITGKDKGIRGLVLSVLDKRVIVEGVNVVTKHQKPDPNRGITGGRVEKSLPIDISNVAIFNPDKKKADRVGFKILEDGRKVRIFKSSGEVLGV